MDPGELIVSECDRAYRLALAVTGEAEAAADAVQEACASILAAGEPLRPVESPRAWFLKAVVHSARRGQRGARRRRAREERWAMGQRSTPRSPVDEAVTSEIAGKARRALAGLEEKFRLPVQLHYQEGLTQAEVAAALGMPRGTVGVYLARGLDRLRRRLKEEGVTAAPAAVLGALSAGDLPGAPPALAAAVRKIGVGAAATAKSSAGGLTLGWKLAAGISLAALLGAGVLELASTRGASKAPSGAAPGAGSKQEPPKMNIVKIGESVVEPAALNYDSRKWGPNGMSFQQDGIAGHKGHQYATYYDAARRLCVARRKLPRGEWEIVRFGDYRIRGNDTHNVAAVGICPGDGTVHLAFDHHGGPLHYRLSRKGLATQPTRFKWEASLFGKVTSKLEPGKPVKGLTYPRFFSTPAGKLHFWFRIGGSGAGDSHLAEYDPDSGAWKRLGQVMSRRGSYEGSSSRCAYLNGLDYDGKGRLHATWCWRETPNVTTNHDLCYAYSDDAGRTWLNNAGKKVGTVRANPITVASPGVRVWEIKTKRGLLNQQTQAVAGQGRIHVVTSHFPDSLAAGTFRADNRYFHYWRDPGGKWHRVALDLWGRRPKLLLDRDGNAYLVFNALKKDAKGRYRAADYKKGGSLQIAVATAAAKWTDWRVVYRDKKVTAGEPLVDRYRWRDEGVISVYAQQKPEKRGGASPLRVVDFKPAR